MTPSVKAPQDDYLEAFKERLRDPEVQRYLASPLFPVTTPDISSEPAHKTPTPGPSGMFGQSDPDHE